MTLYAEEEAVEKEEEEAAVAAEEEEEGAPVAFDEEEGFGAEEGFPDAMEVVGESTAAAEEAAEKEAAEKAVTRAKAATRLPPRLCFFGDTPVFQPRLSWVEAERRRVEAEEAKAGTAKAGTAKLRQLELDELGELVEELKSEQTLTKKELMQRINERGAVATRSQIEKVLAGAWYKASCAICLERTVQTDRRMYELCSHWVCSGCRRKQASMPGVLRCPLCRTVHPRSPEEQRAVQIQRERFMVPSDSDSDSSGEWYGP